MSRIRVVIAASLLAVLGGAAALVFGAVNDNQAVVWYGIGAQGLGLAGLLASLVLSGRRASRFQRSSVQTDRLLRQRTKRTAEQLASFRKEARSALNGMPRSVSTSLASELDRRHLETLRAIEIIEGKVAGLAGDVEQVNANLKREEVGTLTPLTTQLGHLSSRLSVAIERTDSLQADFAREVRLAESRLEAVTRVCSALPLRRPLPPFGDWAIAPDMAFALVDLILTRKPKNIVEAGSGLSTVLMGYALEMVGGGQVVALEHDRLYHEKTRAAVESHGLEGLVSVQLAPLTETHIAGDAYHWYTLQGLDLPDEIDLLVVDGPPGTTNRLARYPALPLLADRLSGRAVVVLDDTNRPDEAETVRRWRDEFGGFALEQLSLEKGASILRRSL